MRLSGLFAAVLIALSLGQTVSAQATASRLLGAKDSGSAQNSEAIGFYSRGCLAGAKQLAPTGPTWQAMRLSRNRNWGHPDMIAYLKRISAKVAEVPGWRGLYIGDISQPRGGPTLTGHRSHQMGLDADIWLLPPNRLNLSYSERESISSLNIRSRDKRNVNGNWTRQHMEVLKIAASDPAVDRIFITAPAKIWMCNNARGNKKWLTKIRPIVGHNTHFHVRLKCPKGSRNCKTQKPTVEALNKVNYGCNKDLNWWVTDFLKPKKPDPNAPKPQRKKHPREYTMAELPGQCGTVLRSR